MRQRTAVQMLAITLLLAVSEVQGSMPQKQVISLHQVSIDGNSTQPQQQLAQQQKLSDKMIDLGSKVPEAAVLENKLTKMVKLEPQVEATLAKVNKVMAMPSPAKIAAAEGETNKAVTKIEQAVHAEKPQAAAKAVPAGGLAQASKQTNKVVAKMKGMVADQLKKQGVDIHNKEIQNEIKAELQRQTQEMMKADPLTKKQIYDQYYEKRQPEIFDQLHNAVEAHKKVIGPGEGKAMNPDVVNTYETSHDQAGERLTIASQGALQVPGTFIASSSGARVCKSGEDEVFDNCVKPQQAEETDEYKEPTAEVESSSEFGTAAMDFMGQVNQELSTSQVAAEAQCACPCQQPTQVCCCKKPKALKKAEKEGRPEPVPLPPAPKEVLEAPVEKIEEQAEEIVKETQAAITAKQEVKPDALVDVFSKALARNAKAKQEEQDNHTNIVSMIKTRIASSTAVLDATRDSLSTGLELTKQVTPPESRKSIEAQVELLAGQNK